MRAIISSSAPSTAREWPSRVPSPQPKLPSSSVTLTNSQRGLTRKYSIDLILAIFAGGKWKGRSDDAQTERRQFQVAERIPGVIYEVARRVKKSFPSSGLPLPFTMTCRMIPFHPEYPTHLNCTPRGGHWGRKRLGRSPGEVWGWRRDRATMVPPRYCGKPSLVEELGELGQVKVWKMRGSGWITGHVNECRSVVSNTPRDTVANKTKVASSRAALNDRTYTRAYCRANCLLVHSCSTVTAEVVNSIIEHPKLAISSALLVDVAEVEVLLVSQITKRSPIKF